MRKHGILRPGPSPEGGRDSFWFCRILTRDPSFVRDDSGLVSSRGRFHGRGISLLVLSGSNPKSLLTSPQDDGARSFVSLRTTTNPRPAPLLCHSEERSDDRGASPEGKNLNLVFKTLNPGPSPRSGRQSQIILYAQDNPPIN